MLENVSDKDLELIVNNKGMSKDFRSLVQEIIKNRKSKPLRDITLSDACLEEGTEAFGYMINELSWRLGNSFLYGEKGLSGGMLGISNQTFNRWSEDNYETLSKGSMARVVAAYNMVKKWEDKNAPSKEIVERFEHMWEEFQKADKERKAKYREYFGII